VKEITVLSGKGGTGKTSLTAAFASMMEGVVLVDCDVDAANLHLLLNPSIQESHTFVGGLKAHVEQTTCSGCGLCGAACRFDAIQMNGVATVRVMHCEGCGVCASLCPVDAVTLESHACGNWFISNTQLGTMVHARLNPGDENSGKLVSILRNSARDLAQQNAASWILVDGPPGIGCPVISSLSGADYALLVTEPTISGFEDLKRVAAVARQFRIPTGIIINKANINPAVAARIEEYAAETGRDVLGKVDCDPSFIQAQLAGVPVLARAGPELRRSLKSAWQAVERSIEQHRSTLTAFR